MITRERVEALMVRLKFAAQPERVMVIGDAEAADLLAILRDCAARQDKEDKSGAILRRNPDRAEATQGADGSYHSEYKRGETFPCPSRAAKEKG